MLLISLLLLHAILKIDDTMNAKLIVLRLSFASLLIAIVCVRTVGTAKEKMSRTKEGLTKVNGTSLYYTVMGQGEPIVMVHGGPGLDHTYLLPQMAALALHHRLIFYDQRASGRSTSLVDTNSMTMDNFVEDLEGIRQVFGIHKMNLLGHSWGGLVAMFYAIKYPENLNSLMLVNPSPASAALRSVSFAAMAQRTSREDSIAQADLVQTEGFKRREPSTMAKFFRILFRGSFYDPRLADSLTLLMDTSYATKSSLIRYLNKDPDLASYDLFPKLEAIHCPTLIVGSDHDVVIPEANEQLHESIPASSIIVLQHCGHFPYIEVPKLFFGALEEFLAKTRN